MNTTTPVPDGARNAPLPNLGLLVAADPPLQLSVVLRCLLPWCSPRYAEPARDDVSGWLASSMSAPGVGEAARGPQPLAIWVADASDADRAMALPGDTIIVTTDERVSGAHPGTIVFPVAGFDAFRVDPVMPFVRARWRIRSGLPNPMIVDLGGATTLSSELRPTALALASAVVASGPDLVEAMAWGAPCVTDPASAAAAVARPGVDCLVGSNEEAIELAARLAGDYRLAAEVARAGRRLVERRHDNHRPALRLARRLGLVDMTSPSGRADAVLDDLGTPPQAGIRRRAAQAVIAI